MQSSVWKLFYSVRSISMYYVFTHAVPFLFNSLSLLLLSLTHQNRPTHHWVITSESCILWFTMQPKYAMVHEYGSHSEPMLFPYLDPNYYTSQYLFDNSSCETFCRNISKCMHEWITRHNCARNPNCKHSL